MVISLLISHLFQDVSLAFCFLPSERVVPVLARAIKEAYMMIPGGQI
jgi:hypothetical protein